MSSIQRLLSIPAAKRKREDLIAMLRCAVKLEHATLPPYLCAMWSIRDVRHPAHGILRGIVFEEMGHMGMACNLLTTVGGTPEINVKGFVPEYPSALPCDIVPRVTPPNLSVWQVGLSRLTAAVVSDIFMIIEYPEGGPIALASHSVRGFHTIGEFYGAIAESLDYLVKHHFVKITGDRQITETNQLSVKPVTNLQEALDAIETIKEQGEGTPQGPGAVISGDELAHYYKFKQIQVGRMYFQDAQTKKWSLNGAFIDFPAVYPMADVPRGGYSGAPHPVSDLLAQFDSDYGSILGDLQSAWVKGGAAGGVNLGNAEITMDGLGDTALQLMQTPIDVKKPELGNYGPTFQPA